MKDWWFQLKQKKKMCPSRTHKPEEEWAVKLLRYVMGREGMTGRQAAVFPFLTVNPILKGLGGE